MDDIWNRIKKIAEENDGFVKTCAVETAGISRPMLRKFVDSKHIWESNLEEVRYTTIGSVIGTHAGPGAVAVAFFKK